MERDITIYKLKDPRNLEVRYIGQTANPTERFATHVFQPQLTISEWVTDLRALNLIPIMEEIAVVPASEANGREAQEIKKHREQGAPLLNRGNSAFNRDHLYMEGYLTLKEAAAIVRVSSTKLTELALKGKITYYLHPTNGRLFFKGEDLEEYQPSTIELVKHPKKN